MKLLAALLLALPAIAAAQFEILDAKTTASLRGIDAVSPQIAWASGSKGTVLLTTDGGTTWKHCAVPEGGDKLDFRGVQAFDEKTAIVMSSGKGDLSRLYKTADGCQTWTLIFTNPDKEGFWDAIYFQDRQFGYLLGDPVDGSFYLAESSDGGKTWIKQRNHGLQADPLEQGAFAASNSSLLVKHGTPLFGSGGKGGAMVYMEESAVICLDDCPPSEMNLDGSRNGWVRQSVPVGNKSEGSGIFALASRGEFATSKTTRNVSDPQVKITVAIGGDYSKAEDRTGTAAFSADDGRHWTAATNPPSGYRSAVAYESDAKIWITVGPNGTDISRDDGRNWSPLTSAEGDAADANKGWNALSLPFVVGGKGKIGKLRAGVLAK